MAKSKKNKRSKRTHRKPSSYRVPFSVCRLTHPFVALSISQAPFLWSELSVFEHGNHGNWIYGANIKLPIFKNEYRVPWAGVENDKHVFPHFMMHMCALASFRLFRMAGVDDAFMCTDAEEQTVNIALAFARQIVE